MPTLHLMVGLPCSGKTTAAKKISVRENALLLTPDVWEIRLFGQDALHPDHDMRHNEIEKIMWDVAERALTLGTSVILDFGFWAKEEREDFRARAKRIGADFKIHYMDVPEEELLRRLEKRNSDPGESYVIPQEMMLPWLALFQPPDEDELAR